MAEPIHHEVVIESSPARVYEALTNAQQFGAVTGAPAEIAGEEGGAFSCFGGHIVGRHLELVPHERIVQAWRAITWDPGEYSIVKFNLIGDGSGTRLVFDHTGFPDGKREDLEPGWHKMYWEPLKRYLA